MCLMSFFFFLLFFFDRLVDVAEQCGTDDLGRSRWDGRETRSVERVIVTREVCSSLTAQDVRRDRLHAFHFELADCYLIFTDFVHLDL